MFISLWLLVPMCLLSFFGLIALAFVIFEDAIKLPTESKPLMKSLE